MSPSITEETLGPPRLSSRAAPHNYDGNCRSVSQTPPPPPYTFSGARHTKMSENTANLPLERLQQTHRLDVERLQHAHRLDVERLVRDRVARLDRNLLDRVWHASSAEFACFIFMVVFFAVIWYFLIRPSPTPAS
ncbi:hypothetical protein B0J14DRAFT_651442 [Halenospora varia]|nr:hypothetical protein B0J14DRAFT_651442 [Halenospora varia]